MDIGGLLHHCHSYMRALGQCDTFQQFQGQGLPGKHHPDNLQFLLKLHNAKKNNANWPRFSLEEQLNYIDSAIKLQKVVIDRLGFENQTEVSDSLIDRISKVYG